MTQRANPKTGCLTAVVRRLLCSGSQQTHPSDNILDSDETLQLLSTYEEIEEPKKETKTETETQEDDVSPHPPPPNVVAKLMGLDNPAPGSNRFRYFEDSGSAVARSKSVNFMDYILRVNEEEEEEDEKDGRLQCRRVRASVSFREIVPTSARSSSNQQQKKHDFLLMYLDKLDEKRELVGSSRSKRFEKVLEDSKKQALPPPEKKKKENEKVAKKFKDERRKVAKKKKSESRSDHVNGAKRVRWFLSPSKSKSSEKMALLGGAESKSIPADEFTGKVTESPESKSNASPVSVLDRDLYDYLILDDDYYFSGDSESASELSTKQAETTAKSSCSSSPARTRTNTKKENNNNTNSDSEETEFITKLMNMLSDLSEEDMKSSTWVSTSSTKPVDYTQVEEFCVEFGQEILDLVMDQLVDELLYLV
ncbi:ALC-interacting protein 1 [Raphanus sativus]|uniref:Uncharacterized protein LOC108826899 n=1 Tax=Raphanus sativus TaxID=3726 RepID=A0A6J0L6I8_RAPSA|nr:uncharacterized protein LOC108826899 [Raphanus sativus]KAJ4911516.1 ALC-interacting protein 1 [Raphanus sativus]